MIVEGNYQLKRYKIIFHRFVRNKSFVIGFIIVFVFLILALFPHCFTKYDPYVGDLAHSRLLPPSTINWLGTDALGRDLFTRIIYGAKFSLGIGLLSVSISLILGSIIGIIAGYCGKIIDEILMRIIDIMLAFPSILLAILIVAILGPGLVNAMIAIGIVNTPIYARLVRSSVIVIRNQEYIAASTVIGSSPIRIIFTHIIPNCLSPIIVQTTLGIGTSVLETAGLSFLGLGVQPPDPEWGSMLSTARDFIRSGPWTVTFPGLAIMFIVLGFNLMGDGLRDLLDPHTAKKL